MSQRFLTITKKVERLLMNGIRTGRLDNFTVCFVPDIMIYGPETIFPHMVKCYFVFIFTSVLQLQRHLSLLSRRQVLPSLSSALRQWTNFSEKPPTGFEKYFDKNNKKKDDDKPKKSNPSIDSEIRKRLNRMSQG